MDVAGAELTDSGADHGTVNPASKAPPPLPLQLHERLRGYRVLLPGHWGDPTRYLRFECLCPRLA